MVAVLDVTPESAWTALWRRLQQDRVGAVSLGIVVAYLVMILFAAAGFLAGDWSREVGVPYANPGFLGERPNLDAALGRRPLGARCARQGDQGLAGLDRGGRVGRALRHRHRHPAWRLRRLLRPLGQ